MVCLVLVPEAATADVMDLLIKPSLARFDYDLEVGPGRVDEHDLAGLHEAALCLVDFADPSPVVAYQCGRRLETGRPTLVLVPADDDHRTIGVDPFRMVRYDLSSARAAQRSVRELQHRIEAVAAGEDTETALERIEAKLDLLLEREPVGEDPAAAPSRSPQERFMAAVTRHDLRAATDELDALRRLNVGDQDLVAAAGYVAAAGWQKGAEMLREIVLGRDEDLPGSTLRPAVSALVAYQLRTPDDRAGATELLDAVSGAAADERREAVDRAFLHNQLHRLHWGFGRTHEALKHAQQAVALNAEEPQYAFNLALVHLRMGALDKAEPAVDAYMGIEGAPPDGDRLSQAIEVYWRCGRVDDARAAYQGLVELDPEQASLVVGADPALRRAVASAN